MRTHYGIDAPGLVAMFWGAGLLLLGGGAVLLGWGPDGWGGALGAAAMALSAYMLGMGGFMLWESLVGKVRGREAILDLVDWRGDERVLDVGCGRGLMLVGAARRVPQGRVVGVDIWSLRDQSGNGPDAALANARAEGVADRVEFCTADMRGLPFRNASFDVVVSSWAVHNLEDAQDRERALEEMARVLRPGGRLLLNDIAHRGEYREALGRLGLRNLSVVVASPRRDRVLRAVSFGSFQPATVTGRAAVTRRVA